MIALLVVVLFANIPVHAADWKFDRAHSSVGFTATHLVVTKVYGQFTDYDGTVSFDEDHIENGNVDVTVQMASINTGNERRDNDLKSPGFFDIEKFPIMTFKSTKIAKGEGNSFTMTGDLTIKGITKPVVFNCVSNGFLNDGRGNRHAGFSAKTTINRQDFGVNWDNKLQDGSLVVGNDVDIDLEIGLFRQI